MSLELKETGLRQFRDGAYDEALATFRAAGAAFAAADDPVNQGEMLNNIGVVTRLLGRHDEAGAALDEAEALFVALGDPGRQAQTRGNRGDLLAAAGDRDGAVGAYLGAAELFAAAGDGYRQSTVLRAASLVRVRQRRWVAAILLMEQSLSAIPQLGPGGWLLRALFRFAKRLLVGRE